MNSNFIRLWDVLQYMERADPDGKPVKFQIKFVSADRNKNSGGEIIELVDCCKCIGQHKRKGESSDKVAVFPVPDKNPKNPNHWIHSTRNLLLPNGQIRKVHIRLIIEFNHQTVCY